MPELTIRYRRTDPNYRNTSLITRTTTSNISEIVIKDIKRK